MIRAAIFDMDGLLVDSEPLWQQAELEIFRQVGVPLDRERCLQTRGKRIEEVVEYWYALHPWASPSRPELQRRILRRVIELVREAGTAKAGVHHVLGFARERGLALGLASSSYYAVIEAVLERLDLRGAFHAVHSAEEERRGKPHPDVYLRAARKLDVPAAHCLAFEDSPAGVEAAKAAGMKCVAVPDLQPEPGPAREEERSRLARADLVLESLERFDERAWKELGGS